MIVYNTMDDIFIVVGDVSKEMASKLRSAGYKWNCVKKNRWATRDPTVASTMVDYFHSHDKEKMEKQIRFWKESLSLSGSTSCEDKQYITIPSGLELLPHQICCVKYMISRDNTLCADEMGLGKTIEAAVSLNHWFRNGYIKRAIVVCPASLKLNWEKELNKWLTEPKKIQVVGRNDVISIRFETDILVINYDLLSKWDYPIKMIKWGAIIVDESHMIKNPTAQRTKAVMRISADKKIALSGTPMPNSPKELWTVAHWLAPKIFSNQWYFYNEYCYVRREFGRIIIDGGKNLARLQKKMRCTFFIRRKKSAVLKNLPDKMHKIIELPHDLNELVEEEKELRKTMKNAVLTRKILHKTKAENLLDKATYKEKMEAVLQTYRVSFGRLAIVRKELGMKKLPICIEHIQNTLEKTDSLVVFTYHKEPAYKLASIFGKRASVITGDTKLEDRNEIVNKFQSGEINLLVGTLGAMGTGLTLTRASNMIMLELAWTPAELDQAEDRCHRIGQKNSVLVQYLVLDKSFDANMINKIVKKKKLIKETIDEEK